MLRELEASSSAWVRLVNWQKSSCKDVTKITDEDEEITTSNQIINHGFLLPEWNAATARKTNSGTRNLILAAGLTAGLKISFFLVVRPNCALPFCRVCSLLYLQSHHMFCMDRRLWYHCPSLPERETSPHRRVLIQALNGAHCWASSHTGLYLGDVIVSVWCQKKKMDVRAIRADNNVHFLVGMEIVISSHATMSLSTTIAQLNMQIGEQTITCPSRWENILVFSLYFHFEKRICILDDRMEFMWLSRAKQIERAWVRVVGRITKSPAHALHLWSLHIAS